MKNAAIPKVKRTPKELLMSVKEQLQFLKDFCRMYDNGNYKYGVLIATRLRVCCMIVNIAYQLANI